MTLRLCGCAVAVCLAACSPEASDSRPPPAPSLAAPSPASAPRVAVAPVPPDAPPIVLSGILYRGDGNPESQAILSVRGQPQQLYRAGEAIDDGWSLQGVWADHVAIARNGTTRNLAVMAAPSGSPLPAARASMPAPGGASAGGARTMETPLPGFVAGAPPRSVTDGTASERNRRFLEAVQRRRAASS